MNLTIKKEFFTKTRKFAISCLVFLFALIFVFTPAFADDLGEKQAELDSIESQISNYQNRIEAKGTEIHSLKDQVSLMNGQLDKLTSEIKSTERKIKKNKKEIDQVTKEIKEKEKFIKKQKKIVGELIFLMYQKESDDVLDIILDSSDLSDFMDQLTYLEVVEKKGQTAINQLKKLKAELDVQKAKLETKKKKLEDLKQGQVSKKQQLDSQRKAKDNLLAKTQGEESAYQEMLGDSYNNASKVQSEIAAIIARQTGSTPGGNYGTGNYPWHGMQGVDPWGFYMGQCTSYSAWKWSTVGRTVAWPGNANSWASNASAQGYQVDQVPEVGSIICWTDLGFYGHVAYIESVSGNNVTFTDYNGWGGPEQFGRGTIDYHDGGWGRIYFIH